MRRPLHGLLVLLVVATSVLLPRGTWALNLLDPLTALGLLPRSGECWYTSGITCNTVSYSQSSPRSVRHTLVLDPLTVLGLLPRSGECPI